MHFSNYNTEEKLKISIVTPNYNGCAFLRQTLESVLKQEYSNLEYIVVDGGSTDSSESIIKEYDTRLHHHLSEPDNGHADAINKGFERSTGEIMGWINSDDILLPGSLNTINRIFRERPDVQWITGRPTAVSDVDDSFEVQPIKKWSRLRFLCGHYRWIQQESTFWRKSLWRRAGGRLNTDLRLASDFELWVRFFRHAELFSVDATLGSFRRRQGQRSSVFAKEYESEALSVITSEFHNTNEQFRQYYSAILPQDFSPLGKDEIASRDAFLSVADPEVISVEECESRINSRSLQNAITSIPSVSVVTPSFNQARFLGRCLDSVESQTLKPIEHLVFDPGSNDGSRDIARERSFVTLIEEADEGQADAVAKGFKRAQGEIVAWLNSDDEFADPNVLSDVVDRFNQPDQPQIVYGRAIYIDEENFPIRSAFLNPDPSQFPEKLFTSVGISQPATFIQKSIIGQIGVPDKNLHFAMDYDYWLRASRAGIRFAFLDKILAKSRYYSTNKTAGQRGKSYSEICDVLVRHVGYVPDEWLHRYADFLASGKEGIMQATSPHRRSASHMNEFYILKSKYGRKRKPVPVSSLKGERSVDCSRNEWVGHLDNSMIPDDLAKFKDVHKGQRCFIMGNGPSLNQMDLNLLSSEIVFGCNSIFLLFDRICWRPTYYTCVDSRVLPDRAPEINAMLDAHTRMIAFFPAVLQEHTGAKRRLPTRATIAPKENCYFFNERPNSLQNPPKSMFSRDINEVVIQPYTVAITMLQIAAYMGFSEIYLIGCDTKYSVPKDTQKEGLNAKGEIGLALTSTDDNDPNHFDPRYFGKDRKWHDPQVEMMIDHYKHAKVVLDELNVEVFNATIGGNLEVFPRVSYASLFSDAPSQEPLVPPLPRTLLIDMTPFGGATATGELKRVYFEDFGKDRLLHLYGGWQNQLGLAPGGDLSSQDALLLYGDDRRLKERVTAFDPDVILYRPVADMPALHNTAMALIRMLDRPWIIWMMDDWPERLRVQDESKYAPVDKDLRELLQGAVDRFAICEQMAEEFRRRYGSPFKVFRNCVDPADWLELAKHPRADGKVRIRYAGSLAPDTTCDSVYDIAMVAERLAEKYPLTFEVITQATWYNSEKHRYGDLEHVSLGISDLDSQAYRQWLADADILVLAYNFDVATVGYLQYSFANKTSEYLASGAAIIAYGPQDLATIRFLCDRGVAEIVDSHDPERLEYSLEKLIKDTQYRETLARSARSTAFADFDLNKQHRHFVRTLSQAAQNDDRSTVSPYGFSRNEQAHIDETRIMSLLLDQNVGAERVMVDVGAHFGTSAAHFVSKGWAIYCFEPDEGNREKLITRFGKTPSVVIDPRAVCDKRETGKPFFTSQESTGISGLSAFHETHMQSGMVDTITLSDFVNERKLDRIDFLKIDVEGFDFAVLKGVPWDRIQPSAVECEFEDAKTIPLGHTWHDMAEFLVGKGYTVYISEWHPIVRYGIQHDWHALKRYPCELSDKNAWGNLLTFLEDPGPDAINAALNVCVSVNNPGIASQQKRIGYNPDEQWRCTRSDIEAKKWSRIYNVAGTTAGRSYIAHIRLKSNKDITISISIAKHGNSDYEGAAKRVVLSPDKMQNVRLTQSFSGSHTMLKIQIDVLEGGDVADLTIDSVSMVESLTSIRRRTAEKELNLRVANRMFREGDYLTALGWYLILYEKQPLKIYPDNALMATRRLGIDSVQSIEELLELVE